MIVNRLVSMHYSLQPLDDSISRKTLTNFVNRFDPQHIYFLKSDVEEFNKYENRIDDLLRRGNVQLALHIFTRFKTRLSQRLEYLEELANEDFDFSKDGSWMIDRKEAPYPENLEDAKQLWRLRFKFDLLALTLGESSVKEAKDRLVRQIRSSWKNFSQYDDNEVVSTYLTSLASAYDPHSTYMAPPDKKNFDINIRLSLEGIGAVLRWEDGYTVVNSIVPGGAAKREGSLKVGDRIIGVAQGEKPFENVIDQRLNDVVQQIRGKRGTIVRLRVMRKTKDGDTILTIAIERDRIVLKEGEAKSVILKTDTLEQDERFNAPRENKIGFIRLPSFYTDFEGRRRDPSNYKSAYRDVRKILENFNEEKVNGVVLDLRNNGGGGLDEAINMAGLFIGRKPIVVIRNSGRDVEVKRSRQDVVYKGPLLIMLNRYSASASEILAGALQDYGRAILVGDETTFGKGTVQHIDTLPGQLGALKVTIAQFYRVAGGSTQNKGVEPDIVLPSLNNVSEVGEAFLENALPWQKIEPRNYRQDKDIPNYLPKLRKASEKRVMEHEDFQKIKRDLDEYVEKIKPREFTSISELQDDHRRNEERKQKRQEEIAQQIAEASNKDEAAEGMDSEEEISEPNNFDGKDFYLEESILILEDYIEHLKGNKDRSVTKVENLTVE